MAGQRPPYRVCVVNKDGTNITYTDYKNEKRTSKYCPIGVLFPSKKGAGFDFRVERKVTLDPEKHFVNVYTNEERGAQTSEKKSSEGSDDGEELFK